MRAVCSSWRNLCHQEIASGEARSQYRQMGGFLNIAWLDFPGSWSSEEGAPWQHFCCQGVVQSRSKANLRRECTQSTYRDQFRRQRFSALLILSTLSWPAHTWIIGICPLPVNCHHCHLFHIQPYFCAICVNLSVPQGLNWTCFVLTFSCIFVTLYVKLNIWHLNLQHLLLGGTNLYVASRISLKSTIFFFLILK